ncbi:MAG: GAF domain-containing protein [Caulobacterales bacterium]|nr:GAF domain-containing protein [Caulobacterales bacterium]
MAPTVPEAAGAQPPASLRETPRLGLAILILALLCAVCAPFFVDTLDHRAPQPRAGVVSYAGWGPLTAPVELGGTWRVVWRSGPAAGAQLTLPVPGPWRGAKANGRVLPEGGAASYLLTVRDLPAGRYVLYLGKNWSGTRVLVNGQVLSERGAFGLTPATSRYVGRAHVIPLETTGAPLELEIDVSTFHHRDNGLADAPVLGLTEAMGDWTLLAWMRSLLLVASLLLMACLSAAVFAFRPQDRASAYLAAGCLLLLPLAAMLTQDNLMSIAMPSLGFTGMMVLQFLTSAAALGAALAYAHELFPRESPRALYLSLQGINAVRFAVYAVIGGAGDIVTLSHLSQMAVVFRTLTFVYILGVVILACVRRREGAVLFLVGMGALVASIVYTDLVNNAGLPRLFGVTLLPVGMLTLLFSQLVLLAERWSVALRTEAQANSDLRRLLDVNISISSEMQLEALLEKIVRVTSKVIRADRSSLFLHDPATDELWSAVAEGSARELRFPADRGLAGWSFTHGEPVSLTDAYADPRFNPTVDTETGYRTRSVLTAPVTGHDGRRLGVMQALNRHGSPAFAAGDLERLSAFAAQAAVAIENAVLFSEVAAERNYNESILRSMSAGVITLDGDLGFAKLNPAAARILEVSLESLDGSRVRAWLSASNPALLAEIDAVAVSGQPKTLLDADVTTARGATISANLSIVPLVREREAKGLLILVEDITEGKRLQGAMRRFMTQKVVDQVMGHGNDLLFGVNCRASVLFADIRNFTALAEQLQARQTVDTLNEVFTELFEAVAANDGVLDKFIGDALMAVYGAPLSSGRDAQNAVASALAMGRMIEKLNAARQAAGRLPLRLGVSIATGDVVAGTIGSPKRMDYTVIGDSVNLAARLQDITKVYEVGVLICEATAEAVAGLHPLRELDTIRVRGRQQPARIFEVLTDPARATSPALAAYREGREALARRRWAEAAAAFERAVALDPADRPSALMLERARILARRPPGRDWDGVWDAAAAA